MSLGGKDAGFSERKLKDAKTLPALELLSNNFYFYFFFKRKKCTIFEL